MKINWLKYRWLYFALSGSLIAVGVWSLVTSGLKLGLDFTGGSLLEIKVEAQVFELRSAIAAETDVASLQQSSDGSFILRSRGLDSAANIALQEKLKTQFGDVEEVRFETIGPVLGRELIQKTLIGLSLAVVFILLYLAYRFKDKTFGICAVLAILSFSVHDTIVLYDRIREDKRLYPNESFLVLANRAISETMTRSINNSLTIIFMLLALFILGGDTTRWFVFALLIGTISGTYSSIFNAAPLLVIWEEWRRKKVKT